MRLILVGCEYSGTTTLANAISVCAEKSMGANLTIHDHFKYPYLLHEEMTDAEAEQMLALPSHIKAPMQFHMMSYHTMPAVLEKQDYILVGLHIDEAVYAPLYKGYGMSWRVPDAGAIARYTDTHIMTSVPDILMVLVKASPEVIAQRMKENPRKYSPLLVKDIDFVLKRFREEFEKSLLPNKFVLETSSSTVRETLADFVRLVEPFLEETDRLRMQLHKIK